MKNIDYWKECIAESAEACLANLSPEQIESIARDVQISHENYSLFSGLDEATKGMKSEVEKELESLKLANKKNEDWVFSTQPCRACTTTGIVRDGWGRDIECPDCRGKGRI